MKNRVLQVIASLPGILFLVTGLRWLIDPAGAAAALGMPLLEGVGRSTQIGDLSAFFLVLALFTLTGVATLKRHWFYAPVALLVIAAFSRIVAWLVQDAALALNLIVPELVIAALLWFTSKPICAEDPE